jgi:hypothetical protein
MSVSERFRARVPPLAFAEAALLPRLPARPPGLLRLGPPVSGRMSGLQLRSTDRASLLVKTHSVVGGISLFKGFLLDLGSQPRCCASGYGYRR